MKTILTSLAISVVGATVLALSASHYALGLYAAAFSTALVLLLATDYAPRARRWEPRSLKLAPTTPRQNQSLQLAA